MTTIPKKELAGRLRTVVHRMAYQLRTPPDEAGAVEVTPTRLVTLATLKDHGPLRTGDLAARMGISAPSVSRLADVLAEAGLVRRERDRSDARVQRLALSPQGAKLLAARRREGDTRLYARLAALDGTQLAALTAALPVLEELAGDRAPAPKGA